MRFGEPAYPYWKIIAWELTSALSTIILLPFIFRIFSKYPLRFSAIGHLFALHTFYSFVFSILHILLMVWMRKLIYFFNGQIYLFGDIFREFLYEYRKDVWAYIILLIGFNLVIFSYSRLKGDAKAIANAKEEKKFTKEICAPKHFIIKKLDSEFLINSEDIEWMESSGNYVNFHVDGRTYPIRSTLLKLTNSLESIGMCRIHRSISINCHQVDNVKYDKNMDGIVKLKSGTEVKLSRTFTSEFKVRINKLSEG